jgi:mannose-6-phosphate isomerase-like protein (cupin superfamily)
LTVLEFDQQTMKEGFSRRPFAIKHTLADNPLLTLDRLAQLADFLPEDHVEHNLAVDVPAVLPGGNAPRLDDATPGEIARGIETNGCWMVLKHAELDPEYRDLLHEALSEVIPLVEDRVGGATKEQAFIFLTAPNATTPLHTDPEENFLLQVKAKKQMDIGTWPTREIEHEHLERYYGGGHRNIDEMPPNTQRFIMEPGDGVHVPLNAPHWVKNFDEVSISFSITFNTGQSDFLNDVYAMNARLRKLRLSPEPPGAHPSSDKAKAAVWRAARRGKRLVQSVSGNGNGDG